MTELGELRCWTRRGRTDTSCSLVSCQLAELRLQADLVSESVQVLDGVDSENGVNRSWWGLEVCEYVVPEELDDIDEDVDRGHTALRS